MISINILFHFINLLYMELTNFIMMNLIIGLFTGTGFAYLADWIKYRDEETTKGAVSCILVSVCFQAVYISTNYFCENTVVMIVLQIIIAVLAFWLSRHNNQGSDNDDTPKTGAC